MSKQSNLEYWRRREAEWEREYQRDMMRYEREIDQIYKNLMDDMQAEIDGWYAKFAKQEGLSMSDAQIKLSKADQDYYARRARELCELAEIDMKAGNRDHENIYFSDLANAEMRIYNAKMRISRMEALKGMLRLETMRATGLIDQRMHDILIKDAEDKLRKEAKILGPTVLGAIHRIPTIVRASFHGATFSKRLWGSHQDTMKRDLQKILARGLIMGESPERFRKQIEKDLQIEGTKAKKAAKRLLATEFARVQVQAQAEAFKEIGIEEFQFVTAAGCCDDCQANDGKIFKLRKGETGGTLPPMHPHCRCAIAPYSDRKEYDEWLDSYKDHGMTFEEWKANPPKPEPKKAAKKKATSKKAKEQPKEEVLKPDGFGPLFTGTTANKSNLKMICAHLNGLDQSKMNPDVLKLYQSVGKLSQRIGHAFTVKTGTKCHLGRSGWGVSAYNELVYSKPSKDGIIGQTETFMHETMHMIDWMLTGAKGYELRSGSYKELLDCFKAQRKPGTDVAKYIKETTAQMDDVVSSMQKKYNDTVLEWNKKYLGGEVSWPEYDKQTKKILRECNKGIKTGRRDVDNGSAGAVHDIYDALSHGYAQDRGEVKFGHGSRYYYDIESRVHETIANYGAMSILNPERCQMIRDDYPELGQALDKFFKEMADSL